VNIDKEKAKRNIETVLEKIHGSTDLSLLREYNKLFKKEVSLFSRRWAAAWLFMYYDSKETPSAAVSYAAGAGAKSAGLKKNKPSEPKSSQAQEDKLSLSTAELALPEEESKRLFISIGKNRRLFPREIITLIMTKTGTVREDIGVIRILDNYSFVQVRDNRADDIIETLNGLKFRGRTLTVNFAKPKTSEDQ